jgi:hypothetical protein
MIINIETELKISYETIIKYIHLSKTLDYIAKPLLIFEPENRDEYPNIWVNGKYQVRMKLFGFLPFGKQNFVIEKVKENHSDEFIFRDNGYGDFIATWDHWIFIRKTTDENKVKYIDRIEIKAGVLTLFIASFAAVFYRWRQRRWKKLILNNFQSLE